MGNTISQYAFLTFFVGAAILWYKPDYRRKLFPQSGTVVHTDVAEKKAGKKNKQRRPGTPLPDSADENRRDRKRKITLAPASAQTAGVAEQNPLPDSPHRNNDQGISDKDFAQQFQLAQSGTKLVASSKSTMRGKQAKSLQKSDATAAISSGLQAVSPVISTSTSSNAGGDEDFGSPVSEPLSSTTSTSRAEDLSINDMLEPEAPRSLMLNITNVGKNENQKPQTIKKQAEVPLNKKQRAARRKAEGRKADVAESLAAHNVKRETQQRLARMADGSSKQTLANMFNSSQQNAWQSGPWKSNGLVNESAAVNGTSHLLDTRDENTAGPLTNGTGSAQNSTNVLAPSVEGLMNQAKVGKRDWADEVNGGTDVDATQQTSRDTDQENMARKVATEDAWSEDIQEQLWQIQANERREQEQQWQEAPTKKNKRKNMKGDVDSYSNFEHGSQQNDYATKIFKTSPKAVRIGSKLGKS